MCNKLKNVVFQLQYTSPSGAGITIALLLMLIVAFGSGNIATATGNQQAGKHCDPEIYHGIQHCVSDDGATEAILIDLSNPHVRFQTVLSSRLNGTECNSVNPNVYDGTSNCPQPYPFETIDSMLRRYQAMGAVAIINTDYFGIDQSHHGAQGLTVRNGDRLDGLAHGDDDNLAYTQASLGISAANQATIEIRPQTIDPRLFSTDLCNTVSGAPVIVEDGRAGNTNCTGPYPGDKCSPAGQSAGGLTADDHLVLATSRGNAPSLAGHLIESYQVQSAIKFDGGGSARLAWLNEQGDIRYFDGGNKPQGRPVAEGLVVFSDRIYPALPISKPRGGTIDGVGIGSSTHLRIGAPRLDQALDAEQALGVRWVREEIPWREVDMGPDAPFRWSYDFGNTPRNFDELLAGLERRDMRMVALLAYDPWYLEGQPVSHDELLNLWKRYVQTAVDRYGDRVDHWEIGNEMNSRGFWGKVINEPDANADPWPALYAQMLRAAYDIIKQHDPADVVILGGLAGYHEDMASCETNYFQYLHDLNDLGVWDAFDVIAVHPYRVGPDNQGHAPEESIERGVLYSTTMLACQGWDTQAFSLMEEMRQLRNLGDTFGPKPIWITEIGWEHAWLTPPTNGTGNETHDTREAEFLVRTYVPLLAEPGVEKVFWYSQYDEPCAPPDRFRLGSEGQQALAVTASLLTGSRPLGQFQGQDDGGPGYDDVYEYRFDKGGQLIIVVWKARGGYEPRDVTLRDLDVATLWAYHIDAGDLSPEAGQAFVVSDGELTLQLTERPMFLVAEKPDLPDQWLAAVQQWWEEWSQSAQQDLEQWWEERQGDLEGWWQDVRLDLETRLQEWLADLERQITQTIEKEIERQLNELCSGAMIGWIVLGGLVIGIKRFADRKD